MILFTGGGWSAPWHVGIHPPGTEAGTPPPRDQRQAPRQQTAPGADTPPPVILCLTVTVKAQTVYVILKCCVVLRSGDRVGRKFGHNTYLWQQESIPVGCGRPVCWLYAVVSHVSRGGSAPPCRPPGDRPLLDADPLDADPQDADPPLDADTLRRQILLEADLPGSDPLEADPPGGRPAWMQIPLGGRPLWMQTPRMQTPRMQTPLWMQMPLGGRPSWMQTPCGCRSLLEAHPLDTDPKGAESLPTVNRMTHAIKNITLPQTSFADVNNTKYQEVKSALGKFDNFR